MKSPAKSITRNSVFKSCLPKRTITLSSPRPHSHQYSLTCIMLSKESILLITCASPMKSSMSPRPCVFCPSPQPRPSVRKPTSPSFRVYICVASANPTHARARIRTHNQSRRFRFLLFTAECACVRSCLIVISSHLTRLPPKYAVCLSSKRNLRGSAVVWWLTHN